MKKLMISTALLVATTGAAAAEVTFSGNGRFGLTYLEDREQETQISYRLRFNIDARQETDSGVTFGGRVRLQDNNASTIDNDTVIIDGEGFASSQQGTTISAAYVYATFEGFRVEVGNASGALDSMKLIYNSEFGYIGTSAGNPIGSFTAFQSSPYENSPDRVGIFTSYAVGDLNLRASWHTQDQATDTFVGVEPEDEFSISADYEFGQFTVSGGYAINVGFEDDVELLALGAAYAFSDVGNVGILYFDLNDDSIGGDDQERITIYANYGFNAFTVRGFVSFDEEAGEPDGEDIAFGAGLDYDLGGAILAGGLQRNFDGDTYGEVGVKFNF